MAARVDASAFSRIAVACRLSSCCSLSGIQTQEPCKFGGRQLVPHNSNNLAVSPLAPPDLHTVVCEGVEARAQQAAVPPSHCPLHGRLQCYRQEAAWPCACACNAGRELRRSGVHTTWYECTGYGHSRGRRAFKRHVAT